MFLTRKVTEKFPYRCDGFLNAHLKAAVTQTEVTGFGPVSR